MKFLLLILLINTAYSNDILLDQNYKNISPVKADPKIQRTFDQLKAKGDAIANEQKEQESKYTKEYSFFYMKLGQPILNINGEKTTGQSTGFGHRRFAETFVYGGELNLLNKKDLIETKNINVVMGYQPQWSHRFIPYILGYIGNSQAKFTDAINSRTIKSNGYVSGLDLGFNIKQLLPLHFTGGMRYEKYNYSKKEIDSMSNQEFYLLLGFEF